MKKIVLAVFVAVAALIVVSCNKEESKDKRVAVFLPSSTSVDRWGTDKNCISLALNALNLDYTIDLADEGSAGAATQVQQIEAAINAGIKTLIITPIDFNVINSSKVLEGKTDLNIVCHDRMIYDSDCIDFYSSCNMEEVGKMQATFLIQTFEASGKSSMTLEMLGGPVSDNNAKEYFEGAWNILKPYVNKGALKILSGKSTYEEVAMADWERSTAEAAIKERLDAFYPAGLLPDLILAPNDNSAIGTVWAVDKHNPSPASYPVITGQDNTDDARALIEAGKIGMTIDKSVEEMSYTTANIANAYVQGITPVSSKFFDNGSKLVPFVASPLTIITKSTL